MKPKASDRLSALILAAASGFLLGYVVFRILEFVGVVF
jgi:hypothetical protein